ncbi:hypothetical protein Taro_028872 [Colocasia esculenta]|uniref:Uncharacterized protein n=1 Tax=Colocasia esculenta TaxID=4460 RepID=A0A843VPF1_COLES|nr:hypothetical protein [Colocasia esculenta]
MGRPTSLGGGSYLVNSASLSDGSSSDRSSRSGSRVQRSRTVDDMPETPSWGRRIGRRGPSRGHPSQAVVPTTQGASSAASASSSVAETPSWGRGSGRRGPSRGATERRLEPGQK